MIRNHLKILFRTSLRDLGFTLINILGLMLGIASCIAITLFVKEELSYDTFHNDYDKIFRVYTERTYSDRVVYGAPLPVPFANEINNIYSEVSSILEVRPAGKRLFKIADKLIYEHSGMYASEDFFEFFNLGVISGEVKKSLSQPDNLIITESMAKKYFGANWSNVVNEEVVIDNSHTYRITAIVKDPPSNFHLKFDYLISRPTLNKYLSDRDKQNWLSPRHYVYLRLNKASDRRQVEDYLSELTDKVVDPKSADLGYTYEYLLQPVKDIHLHSNDLRYDIAEKGNVIYVKGLTAIAALILLLACANFINLSTARASKRAKEVGLRKVSGASRTQIIIQFLSESFVLVVLAMILGALLVEISLPFYNTLLNESLEFTILQDNSLLFILCGILMTTSILSGGYTAFYISSIKPARVLKESNSSKGFNRLRRVLVVFQLSISLMLILGSIILYNQIDYLKNKDLGFNKNEIVVLPVYSDVKSQLNALKNQLLKSANIESVTASYGLPGSFIQGDNVFVESANSELPVKMYLVDNEFIETLGMEIVSGRNFNGTKADEQFGFIANEKAIEMMGFTPETAIGQNLEWNMWIAGDTTKKGPIIGVVKDFNYGSLHQAVEPVIIHQFKQEISHLAIKIKSANIDRTLDFIESTYSEIDNNRPFSYSFLDEYFDRFYKNEQSFSSVLQVFTFLVILVATLGLLGLAAYSMVSRRKEIGIRKVHGATVQNIIKLIHSDIFRLTIYSTIVAIPITIYLANQWLENYAYRVSIGWQPIIASISIIIIITSLTVIYFSTKAALTNPATVLRNE
ncbi:MAG: FtsX-like permease family protein [Fulvivirga sp.]